ncbi:MAG: hypothetical protein IK080_04240 [Clostridia bacterium]|nr:hypothetical protein [Clostridia bacterium]
MKRIFALLLALCLLGLTAAPAGAQEVPAAGDSLTLSLLEQIETADAFRISVVLSADDGAVQTLYFQGDACASDYRSARFPLTVRSLYLDEKGYLFLPALPLFYLPADATSAVRRTQISAELHAAVDGRPMQTGTYTRDGIDYTLETFGADGITTSFAFQDGKLRLILIGDETGPTVGLAVTVRDYDFTVPARVFRKPLLPLGR